MTIVPRVRFALVWGAAAASVAACAAFGSSANDSASPEGADTADAASDGAASDEAADAAPLDLPEMEPVDGGTALDAAALRRIWVSSGAPFQGIGLGERAGARCSDDARTSGLTRGAAPLLSSDNNPLRDMIGPNLTYARLDGTVVGTGTQLLEGALEAPVLADSGVPVWTGATETGGVATMHCLSWSKRLLEDDTKTRRGATGLAGAKSSAWLASSNSRCDSLLPVYCVEKR